MRRLAFAVVSLGVLASCVALPAYENGALVCDQGQCPPGMECRSSDNRCYTPGAGQTDAPLTDGPVSAGDGPLGADGPRLADAPIGTPDSPAGAADGPPCTTGARHCVNDNLEICQGGVFQPALPSCASMSQHCFDPGAEGGTDAYCGTCLKGAERCTTASPPVRQTCPAASGIWTDAETCSVTGQCFDDDGPDGPEAHCGECTGSETRCNGGLQTCDTGLWPAAQDCTATPGWSCFDPPPPGTDAYCGLCLKDQEVCHADDHDQCNAQGTAFMTLEACTWGCNSSTVDCCAAPTCGSRTCGSSPPNACGKTMPCGTTCSGPCCNSGTACCGANQVCCGGTQCCGPLSQCCSDGVCRTNCT